jgi:transketolase
MTSAPSTTPLDVAVDLARQFRVDSIRVADAAGSGHPTSSLSAADLVAVLVARHLRWDTRAPDHPDNDRLVFSKGHASPLLYAAYRALGVIDDDELATYRQPGSRLEGHPTPRLPGVPAATGSLGLGLGIGAGLAFAGKALEHRPYQVWVLCGDGELAEGSVWEAAAQAGELGLGSLTALVDVNRMGQTGPTRLGWDLDTYARRFEAFGWRTEQVDGHDVAAVDEALSTARSDPGRPLAVLARTRKGAGVSEVEDQPGMHGKVLADPERAIDELGGVGPTVRITVPPPAPSGGSGPSREVPAEAGAPGRAGGTRSQPDLPAYAHGESASTRSAFGAALVAIARTRDDIVGIDGDVGNSTMLGELATARPDRFLQCYIAEQSMVAMALGLQANGWRPVVATFGAFFTRAHDIIRMAAVSRADLVLVGSHAGVSIGEDGPSQMGLEDVAMMRAIHGATVLCPCDANQTAQVLGSLLDRPGIGYLRTIRGDTPVIYPPGESFPIGGSRTLRRSGDDQVTIVAAGISVHEALAAADELDEEGLPVRVLDCYSVEPLDSAAVVEAVAATDGRLVVVEDHRPQGGLADAVLQALAPAGLRVRAELLGVRTMPGSAPPARQLDDAGIAARHVAEAARRLVVRPGG